MTLVTFATHRDASFVDELKHRVAQYFETEEISDKANALMVLKTCGALCLYFIPYGLILTHQFSLLDLLGLAVVMGTGAAGIGFCIAHDALHGAYSSNPQVNKIMGLTFDLLGANGYMWKLTHNIIHHTYTNIQGLDEDLEVSPLLRLSPRSKLRWIHRYQHQYGYFTYAFATLYWVFVKDYKYFLQRDLGPFKNKKHPAAEVTTLLLTKLFYYAYTIAIPWIVLDVTWWQFLLGYVAMQATGGLILGVIFQLAHVVEETEHPAAGADGAMDHGWVVHEMETTSNFGRDNKLLTWYVGGLNFQIEHHLFPKVCSIHYPVISKIVREVAARHGVRYNHHATLRQAVGSHYRTLKKYGKYGYFAPAAS